MKLLREFNALDYDPIEQQEMKQKRGFMYLRGILQKADALNQNGRIYPRAVLEREIENYQKFIQEKRSTGECDHPDSSIITLEKVSHLVTEARMDSDGVVYGTIKILNTPAGLIIQELVNGEVKLGISSRGVGSTESQSGNDIVQDDFQLICFDMVSEPSTPNAFMMAENFDRSMLKKVFKKSDRIFRAANEVIRVCR